MPTKPELEKKQKELHKNGQSNLNWGLRRKSLEGKGRVRQAADRTRVTRVTKFGDGRVHRIQSPHGNANR